MTSIPQTVKTPNLRAEFYRNEPHPQVWVKISNLSNKDWVPLKATIEHMKQFPHEFEAFEKGKTEPDVGGTPITDVPGISEAVARMYRLKNVRNAEELAALSDAACSAMGTGVLAARKAAQMLIKANQTDALQAQVDAMQAKRGPGRPPKESEAA